MENLVHDLPLPVYFQQREQISEPVTSPVFEFKPHIGDRINEVNTDDMCLKPCRWPIFIVPVKKTLYWPGK